MTSTRARGETVTVGGTTAGLTVRPATLTITDDDMRGIVVTQGPVTLLEEGSTEYGVALSSQPTDEVSVQVQVSGNPDVTVDATTLTFTTADWSQPQPVTVMAAHDDDGNDDTAELRHTASGADYRGVTADPVPVTVTDNDERGVLLSRTDFSFREEGQATYTVQLATQPSGPVTVTPMVPADSDVRVSPLSLLFAPSNWNRPQTFTLRAGEDADQIDDNIRVTHTVTGAGLRRQQRGRRSCRGDGDRHRQAVDDDHSRDLGGYVARGRGCDSHRGDGDAGCVIGVRADGGDAFAAGRNGAGGCGLRAGAARDTHHRGGPGERDGAGRADAAGRSHRRGAGRKGRSRSRRRRPRRSRSRRHRSR